MDAAGDIFMSLFAPAIEVGVIRPARMAQRCRMPRSDGSIASFWRRAINFGSTPGPDKAPIPRTVQHRVQGAQKDDRNA